MNDKNSGAIEALIRTIASAKRLSKEEETRLILEYQQTKDKKTADRLVQSNIKHLVFYVKKYMAYRIGLRLTLEHPLFLDLFQEAAMGFLSALDTCDPEKGCIRTYSGLPIRVRLLNYMSRNYPILRTPRQKRIPTKELFTEVSDPNTDEPPTDAVDTLRSDRPSPEELVVISRSAQKLFELPVCDKREVNVLKEYYLNRRTFKQVGSKFGICRDWARKVKLTAESKIKERLHGDLSSYLHHSPDAEHARKSKASCK